MNVTHLPGPAVIERGGLRWRMLHKSEWHADHNGGRFVIRDHPSVNGWAVLWAAEDDDYAGQLSHRARMTRDEAMEHVGAMIRDAADAR